MTFRFMLVALWSVIATAAQAHPGHPAMSPQHGHAILGVDPVYALLVTVVGVAGAVLIATRRRARSKSK